MDIRSKCTIKRHSEKVLRSENPQTFLNVGYPVELSSMVIRKFDFSQTQQRIKQGHTEST